jgi:uncharacterized protein with HEPN domain
MRTDRERVEDILDAIIKIEKYSKGGRKQFEEDELVQVWILHHLEIIGEASRSMGSKTVSRHPEVPWVKMGDMRNYLTHEYFGVDDNIVWNVVERELPKVKGWMAAILKVIPEN